MAEIKNPFQSFWMGGYECTDQLNTHGNRVDFLHITSHLELINEDYKQLQTFSITTVREGIRWSQIEKEPYEYDFSTVHQMIDAGKANGVQQIWDICHFGYPDDLSPLHPHFTRRFVALCKAFATFYFSVNPDETLIVTPINEVSFISWLGGDVAGTSPYCRHNGWEVKYGLMRAYIAGVKAFKEINPATVILTTEPLVNMVPPLNATPEEILDARKQHELQFQSVDMLCGKICPELGGKPEYLDILGFNYYYNNQWVIGNFQFLGWNDRVPDPRFRLLSDLLRDAYLRYNRPIALTETSHPGVDRPVWIRQITSEIGKVLQLNIPFWGVCIYPIIDRPDWDNLKNWHHSGVWDTDSGALSDNRILHEPSAHALLESQQKLANMIR
ncbi:family 1 glycosylhydrolase [Dyadobacter sp. NIV53]|uniref:family 1 glycosylhydrolase n=1 Tax=Dyadobacter sp. NIV53 TaxID=2861765 RepID=UPI001E61CF21|nr:family 1 glycosylhydrolase [Dyadobacter sp. NIV53]